MENPADTQPKRLKILGDDEIESIYGIPHFTHEERIEYFSLSPSEKATLEQLHSIKSRIYFILQLGYFKARYLFFAFGIREVYEDAKYIQKQYFPDYQLTEFKVTKITRLNQQYLILSLCNYRSYDAEERQKLETKAQQVAMVCSKPIYIFREIMHYLSEERIVAPMYSSLQDTIGKALKDEQNRLISIARRHLKLSDIQLLKTLISDSQGLHEITLLKREPKDFSLKEIKQEINREKQINHLYCLAKSLLPHLSISNESIKYYASLVTYYTVFRLCQLNEWIVYVYLLCFIYHRYQKLHDNLINCLIYNVRGYIDDTKSYAKERVYESIIESNQDLQKAGTVLKIFTDDSITGDTPFYQVQEKAFGILERQKLDSIADHITKSAKFDETAFQWEQIDKLASQFKRHLRPILLTVDFASSSANDPLIETIKFLKNVYQKGKPLGQYPIESFPKRFIPEPLKRYLYAQDAHRKRQLQPNRYEFLVYRLLRNSLEAGDIFCRDSVRFRSFEDDLLDNQKWEKKEELIASTGLTILNQPIRDHLAMLEQTLENRITEVNQRIAKGLNEHFQIKKHGQHVRWTLKYPSSNESVNHPFFNTLKQVEIRDVLHFVNRQCRFMDVFEHVLLRYTKQDADDTTIAACIIAWGTNMGLGKMSEISDIQYHTLSTTSDNFIRLETLSEANDRVCNAIAKLPIFQYYNIGETTHSSSDGQKFETRIHTINARYSPKYFGLKKGIVSYTLVANNIPANATIIGANDSESHYVFDILFNNTTDIQPDIHSTDTHGSNEVNFAILHLFGYQFAPRYLDIYDRVSTSLYGFKHPSQYGGILKPIRKIDANLIVDEWDNIQRINVSLALKTTTQSIIIGKLSTHARKNKTKRALWEYDNIIKSLYLLDYVDSPSLRSNVQHALNRGETYHQLHRAISFANFGKLRFRIEYEQQIWNECGRLIANCIIYYNAAILSNLLSYKEETGDIQDAETIKEISPIAWQHTNLHGRYEFSKLTENINIDAIVQELAHIPIKQNLVK
jgi:TnpA family transposase